MIQYIIDNYFTIYGIMVAVLYPLWIFVIVPIIEKISGEYIDWTELEDFFGVTLFLPLIGAFLLLFWPLTFTIGLVAGIFFGAFYLNKARIERKELMF